MLTELASTVQGKLEPVKATAAPARPTCRAGLFLPLLVCALAVFVFGSHYYMR